MTPEEAIEAAELVEAENAYRRQVGREMYAAGYAAAEADMDVTGVSCSRMAHRCATRSTASMQSCNAEAGFSSSTRLASS